MRVFEWTLYIFAMQNEADGKGNKKCDDPILIDLTRTHSTNASSSRLGSALQWFKYCNLLSSFQKSTAFDCCWCCAVFYYLWRGWCYSSINIGAVNTLWGEASWIFYFEKERLQARSSEKKKVLRRASIQMLKQLPSVWYEIKKGVRGNLMRRQCLAFCQYLCPLAPSASSAQTYVCEYIFVLHVFAHKRGTRWTVGEAEAIIQTLFGLSSCLLGLF